MSYTEKEVVTMLEKMNVEFQAFMGRYDKKFFDLETALGRRQFGGGGSSSRGDGVSFSAEAKEHTKQFLNWVRRGDVGDLKNLEIQARDASTLSDPEGGFLVAEELERSIEKLSLNALVMRRLAMVKQSTGEYKKPLSVGGAGGGWVSEKGTRSETDTPELHMFEPPFSDMYALPKVTQNLLDMSSFDVSQWLIDEITDVLTSLEGAAFISGNGVGRPKGITAYETIPNANWVYGKVGYIASGHASLINNVDKLRSLKHALRPVYRRNGVWLMNDTTQEVIANFKDGNGNWIWKEGLTEDAPDTLLGRPVEIDDNMPDIGGDAYPIAFGDFKRAYTIIDHTSGMRLLRDNLTQKGWVLFYLVKKIAGGISNFEAIRFMKIALT
jgi:HK97 family phage major capsid protein